MYGPGGTATGSRHERKENCFTTRQHSLSSARDPTWRYDHVPQHCATVTNGCASSKVPSARQDSLESFPVRIHTPWAQALQALPPELSGGNIADKTRGIQAVWTTHLGRSSRRFVDAGSVSHSGNADLTPPSQAGRTREVIRSRARSGLSSGRLAVGVGLTRRLRPAMSSPTQIIKSRPQFLLARASKQPRGGATANNLEASGEASREKLLLRI